MQILSQRDPRWKDITLGTSGTIGEYGCTITCISMAADLLPPETNERIKAVSGYSNGNLVIWTKLQAAIPWIQFETRGYAYDNDRVKAAIEKNNFCLVEVDGSRIGGVKHWVLYIGNGLMYDPWTGVEKSTSYYPATGYAILNRVGEPPKPQEPAPDPAKLIEEIASLKKEVLDKNTQISNYATQVEGLVKKYEECNTQRIEAVASSDGFRKQFNDFVAQLAQILGTRQETVEIITSIETAITFEDKATQLDRQIALERQEHAQAIDALEKKFNAYKSTTEAKTLELEREIKHLKDAQTTPQISIAKTSLFAVIIKKVLSFLKG